MNCQEARNLVELALDRNLSGGVKRRFDLHLSRCEECRTFFAAEQAEHQRWFRAVNSPDEPRHSLPSGFADRLAAAVVAHAALRRPFFMRMPRWALLAASLVLMAGFVFAAAVAERLSSIAEATSGGDAATAQDGTKATESTDATVIEPVAGVAPYVPAAPSVSSIPSTPSSDNQLEINQREQEMNIKKKAVTALAAATLAVAPTSATELPWTGGDATLGDGKIVILCDGSGNVTNIVAKPTGGEELRIIGNAMTFAAGAIIDFALPAEGAVAGGSLVFANDVTAAGALNVTRSDGAYVVWSDTANPLCSEDYTALIDNGVSSVADWELVMAYAQIENFMNYVKRSASGPYLPLPGTGVVGGNGAFRIYALNQFQAQFGYTCSMRIQMVANANQGKLYARANTVVHSPNAADGIPPTTCLPYTDLWDVWHAHMPNKSGLYCIESGRSEAHGGHLYGGSTRNFQIDRLVLRRAGSAVSVGFAGEAALNGTVDVALGVKLSVLPKESSTFTAPVFCGQGDVEYQRNATLSKMNYMTYASILTVTNGALVTVSGANAFPTNAIVNICKDGIMRLTATVANIATGISGGYANLRVYTGGELQVGKDTGGKIANGRQEIFVDGGTYWAGWPLETSNYIGIKFYTGFLTLLNNAHVKGPCLHWGNNGTANWYVGGVTGSSNTPCTIEEWRAVPYRKQPFTMVVNNITGTDEPDLVVGNIPSHTETNFGPYNFRKYGGGTIRVDGMMSITMPLQIFQGTFLFGDTGGVYPKSGGTDVHHQSLVWDVELSNGATFGKTAGALTLDTLTVTDGGVLELGRTASISFADSHAKVWTGTLVVKGFREGAVRFGTTKDALDSDQQSLIRAEMVDGKKLHLLSNGYLAPYGTMFILR